MFVFDIIASKEIFNLYELVSVTLGLFGIVPLRQSSFPMRLRMAKHVSMISMYHSKFLFRGPIHWKMAHWIRFSKQLQIIFSGNNSTTSNHFFPNSKEPWTKLSLSLSLVVPLQKRISYSAILTHLSYMSLLRNIKFALQSVPNSNSMFAQECNWV